MLRTLALVLLCSPAFAQIDSLGLARLLRQADSLNQSDFMQHGLAGLVVKSTKTGQNLLAVNAKKSLATASTMKLISTATALATLGEGHTYQTTLEYDGDITDGTLQGNLYLRGSGDPSLGSWRYGSTHQKLIEGLVLKIREAGIERIEGRIIADATVLEEMLAPDYWPWGDLGIYYGAGASGLNFHENLVKITYQGGKNIGEAAKVLSVEPELPNITFINQITTAAKGSGDQTVQYSRPYDTQILMTGTVPLGQTLTSEASIPDPALTAVLLLKKELNRIGVTTGEATTAYELMRKGTYTKPETKLIYIIASPSLAEVVRECNFESINLYAEALMKTAGVKMGAGTTNDQATKAMKQLWASKGVNLAGFNPKDGSGLAPQDAVTPQNMADILEVCTRESFFNTYFQAIPVLGRNGTVKNLGKKTRAEGRIHAKSGTISAVKGYAGYVYAKSGELLCFSFLLNKYADTGGNAMRELEKLLVILAEL